MGDKVVVYAKGVALSSGLRAAFLSLSMRRIVGFSIGYAGGSVVGFADKVLSSAHFVVGTPTVFSKTPEA